jgi:hypothetical protein
MSALASRLGSNILTELVHDLEDLLVSRVCSNNESSYGIEFQRPLENVDLAPREAEAYVDGQYIFHQIKPDA